MKILHLDENHPLLIEQLNAAGFQNTIAYTTPKEEVERILPEFDGIVVRSRFPIDANLLNYGKRLKFIARVGAGWKTSIKKKLKFEVFSFRSTDGECKCLGEHALGMLLSLMNKLNLAHQSIQQGEWLRKPTREKSLKEKLSGSLAMAIWGKFCAKASWFRRLRSYLLRH